MPRLYTASDLAPDASISLEEGQSHYLRRVMRLKGGAALTLFNGRHGEFSAVFDGAAGATVGAQTRPQPEARPPVRLYLPVIKKDRLDMLVEKAVELGAAQLQPVLTRRAQPLKLNLDRLAAQAVEAAEQCERLTVPAVLPPVPLAALPADLPLIWAAERSPGAPPLACLRHDGAVAFLVGPEGGFAPEEREFLARRPDTRAASLGESILRAETAAIVMLAVWGKN
ncbi:ribosomal RNA small subunit methyltransferase E [Alphaproteobacteria bacterium]|nr:ribosomal RNA small subunit methyltransferase E [Alphaproteobacteria bacterium]